MASYLLPTLACEVGIQQVEAIINEILVSPFESDLFLKHLTDGKIEHSQLSLEGSR
jgi:hypothetical protein